MALELKGLKAKAMAARANIGKLDAAYAEFNAKAGSHVSDVEGLTEQIGEMTDDLSFITRELGNSVAGSNAGATEKPKETPPPSDNGEQPKAPPVSPATTAANPGAAPASQQPGS